MGWEPRAAVVERAAGVDGIWQRTQQPAAIKAMGYFERYLAKRAMHDEQRNAVGGFGILWAC